MSEKEEQEQPVSTKEEEEQTSSTKEKTKEPTLFRNFISFLGLAVIVASITSIIFLFMLEITGANDKPYLGIFTYIIFPSIMMFGIFITLVGALFERRRRRKYALTKSSAYPTIDLNDPKRRRSVLAFLACTLVFIFVSAFGSYRAYEYTDSVAFCGQLCHSVMKPEFVAYQASPHARVLCVDCHVGPGAEWYVRSKISGMYQVYSVAFEKYPRPITTPVHNLRPARDTCEQCHWPEKFFGAQLKIFNHYGYDEKNSLKQVRMLINTGGGSPKTGLVGGAHWHVYPDNEVTYVSSDAQRQVIPWVQMRDKDGSIIEFRAKGATISDDEVAKATKRKIDCVDCHNRPAHIYVSPDKAVNEALNIGKLDASLPYLKREAVATLTKPYTTTDEAVSTIAKDLESYYRTNHAFIYEQKNDSIKKAIAELQRIFQTYMFPEMKVDWRTHYDNLSHYNFQGCFRCHDGEHFSKDGKVIRNDCNICHTVLDQTVAGNVIKTENGSFKHSVNLGALNEKNCVVCHKDDGAFQHPVALGDLKDFQCAECHKEKGLDTVKKNYEKLH